MNDVWTDQGPVSGQADQIRTWIHGSATTFDLKGDTPWWALIVFGGLILVDLLGGGIWLLINIFKKARSGT